MSKDHQVNFAEITKKDQKRSLVKNMEVFLKMEKDKIQQYGSEQQKNLSEDKKTKTGGVKIKDIMKCRKITTD